MANSEPELTELDGVGPSTADNLRDHGLDTVEAVADADDDVLADAFSSVPSVSEDDLDDVRVDAASLVDDTSDTDAEDVDADETASTDAGDSDQPSTQLVELEASGTIWLHTIRAILDEAVRMRQRNHVDDEQSLYRIATELMTELSFPAADGQFETDTTITAGFEATNREVDYVHQAVSAGISNYRSMSGITTLWGDLQLVLDQLDDVRADLR